jgi:hypothetical protein
MFLGSSTACSSHNIDGNNSTMRSGGVSPEIESLPIRAMLDRTHPAS